MLGNVVFWLVLVAVAAAAGFGVPDKVEKEATEVGYIAPR